MQRPPPDRVFPLLLLLLGVLLIGSCEDARHLVGERAPRAVLGGAVGSTAVGGRSGGNSGGNDGLGGFAPPLPEGPGDHVPGRSASAVSRPPSLTCIPRMGPPTERTVRVDAPTLANRLSRLINYQPADAQLIARVAALRTSTDVKDLAREMRRNPLALAGVTALVERWLRLDEIRFAVGASTQLSPELKASFQSETRLFAQHVLLDGGGLLGTLLTASYTFADGPLTDLYGHGAGRPAPGMFTRIDLDPAQRSGILTHPGLLFANPRPSQRGLWLRDALLCQLIPPPPPNVDSTLPMTGGVTTRERLEAATSVHPACGSCHRLMDPPGFALDHFDDLGRWRTMENGSGVSAATILDHLRNSADRPVNGAPELGRALAESCDVQLCTIETFLRHALGDFDRNLAVGEINELWGHFAASGFDLRELIIAVTGSEAFLTP